MRNPQYVLNLKLCIVGLSLSLVHGLVMARTLDDLLYSAMQSYPSILSRQAIRDAAQTDVTAAKLRFLPNPSFNTQRNRVQFDGGSSSGQMPSTNVAVSQPLFIDGGIIAGYNKADAKLSAADFAVLETREDVSKRLINTYAEWVKAWLKIQAYEESVRLHERFASMITRRYDQGVASGSDRDLGVSRLSQAIADLDTQRSQEQTALTGLSELVGEPITRADLIKNIAKQAALPKRADGIARAQQQSVTVQRNKFEAEAAEQEAKEVRAQGLPQLSLQAQRQIGNAYFPGAQGFNSVGLVVSYSPGGGLSSIASASAAMDRARAATIQVETTKRELGERLSADYNEYEFSLLKKSSLQNATNLTSDIASSYDRQYLVGRKSWLDLMNSVREQTQTKAQLAEVEGSLLAASRRLLIYIDGTMPFDTPSNAVVQNKP